MSITTDNESDWTNFSPLKRRKIERVTTTVKRITNQTAHKTRKNRSPPSSSSKHNTIESIYTKKENSESSTCPICQMPFIFTPNAQKMQHVSQCLNTDWTKINECPEKFTCNSTDQSHFKDFTHYKLAEFRANTRDETQNTVVTNEEANSSQKENNFADVSPISSPDKKKTQLDIRNFFSGQKIVIPKTDSIELKKEPPVTANASSESLINENNSKTPGWKRKWWGTTNQDVNKNVAETKVKRKRECPFYKKIPDTSFSVDAFSYGEIPDVNIYFLTHFHSDHYQGLSSKFKKTLYCSPVTANLINSQLRVSWNYINVLNLNESVKIENADVIFLDANHCPGSVMILFRLPNGRTILHTGDFRGHRSMESYPPLTNVCIDVLYLDTTYCNPKYDFPSQDAVVEFCVDLARRSVLMKPRTLFVCGSYTIGKEKVFLGIAKELGLKVCALPNKLKVLSHLDEPFLKEVIVNDWKEAQIHVLPMQQLNFKTLMLHLERYQENFTNIVALKPTGWEYRKDMSLHEIKPRCSGNVAIYGLPYSEHSSFLELKRFIQFLKPSRIIPTVNVGRVEERNKMQCYFKEWCQSV